MEKQTHQSKVSNSMHYKKILNSWQNILSGIWNILLANYSSLILFTIGITYGLQS